MKKTQARFVEAWERLIAARADYEETASLGRLFNALMVIGTGVERQSSKSIRRTCQAGENIFPGACIDITGCEGSRV